MKLNTLKYIWFATLLALCGVLLFATNANAEMADEDDDEYIQRIGYLRQKVTLGRDAYPVSGQRSEYRKSLDAYYSEGFKDKETPLANVVSDPKMRDKMNSLYSKQNVVVQRYVIGF